MSEPSIESERNPAAAGVQSAEVALALLRMLGELGGSASLSAIAGAANIAPAKAHRYMVSLMRAGFVEQTSRTGAYRLGAQALRVGLVALGRLEVMENAAAALAELCDATGENALLAVWGDGGPTVVQWLESSHPVTVNVRVGSHMPLLSSATGLVFGAWSPWPRLEPFVTRELAARQTAPTTVEEAKRLFSAVRDAGLSCVDGQLLSGVQALGAPVFDAGGALTAVMTVLGSGGSFDLALDGRIGAALRDTARRLSEGLGHGALHPSPRPAPSSRDLA